VNGLALLALAEYRLGGWNDAVRHAELGVSIAEDAELGSAKSLVHASAAWPAAGRGDWEIAEAHVSRAIAAARCPSDLALGRMADAVVAFARGDHERVVGAVAALRVLGSPGAVDDPAGLWRWQEVYIDALIALGLLDAAEDELVRFELVAASHQTTSCLSSALRLRGSLEMVRGRHAEASDAFRAAFGHAPQPVEPFAQGLLHASHGEFLRRWGKRSAAAVELKAAREVFARLGAHPYVDRCDQELASLGLRTRERRSRRTTQLTPREASVARLVSEGKRNRQIARELVVSENTIEYHLKNIYAKLGVASRSQMIVRLGARSEGARSEGVRGAPGSGPHPAAVRAEL
jgi:DNA-binding CsgD family transcriptional regulator